MTLAPAPSTVPRLASAASAASMTWAWLTAGSSGVKPIAAVFVTPPSSESRKLPPFPKTVRICSTGSVASTAAPTRTRSFAPSVFALSANWIGAWLAVSLNVMMNAVPAPSTLTVVPPGSPLSAVSMSVATVAGSPGS